VAGREGDAGDRRQRPGRSSGHKTRRGVAVLSHSDAEVGGGSTAAATAVDANAAEAKRWVDGGTAELRSGVAAATARGVFGASAAVVVAVSPRRRSAGVAIAANLPSSEHATPPAPTASSMAAGIRMAVI